MNINKNKILILFILALVFAFKLNGKPSILQGQIAEPAFNDQGDLIYIYKNVEEKISLGTLKIQAEEPLIKPVPLRVNAFSPVVEKDRKGQIWIVWEEWEYDQSKILLGQLKEDKIISYQIISQMEGFNFSSDLYFDVNNHPWVIWINYTNTQYKVFVQEVISQKTWLINSSYLSSAFTPKIIIDSNNLVWAFWSGKDEGEEEIFYRTFDQDNWSPLTKINRENKFPHLYPEIVIDQHGFLWLVWSGYDGQDYEIYCSFWDGKNWSEEIKITNNSQKNDIFPSISIISGNVPIITWAQSGKEGSQIYIKFLENNVWSKEIKISSTGRLNTFPKMVTEGEKIGIVWQSQNEIKAKLLYFNQLKEKNYSWQNHPNPQIIYNPSLNENKYIGFGNSITYGYLNRKPAPEKGYLPRLETILNQNFGETEVVNEGWPGEITINGLSRIESVIRDNLARYLLLMEGTNDVIFNRISMDSTAFNLKEMVKRCLEFGVFPAIATIIPRSDWRWYFKFYRDRIFYLNQKIYQIAGDFFIPLVDQFDSFYNYPEEDGGWKSLLSDGVHPSEKGYQLMADEWFEEIKNFPFPPINIQVKRMYNEILFYRELGNYITWLDNLKIYDKNNIRGYKIYRKNTVQGNDQFQLIKIISDQWKYFDKEIIPSEKYTYAISTLRMDEVEGPGSGPVKDH
ncbi:MAG: GDSL-type esterase/lipase family protein [Candidatus Aminicenantia bacterium]